MLDGLMSVEPSPPLIAQVYTYTIYWQLRLLIVRSNAKVALCQKWQVMYFDKSWLEVLFLY